MALVIHASAPDRTEASSYSNGLYQDVVIAFPSSSSSLQISCEKAVVVAGKLFLLWKLFVPGASMKCDRGYINQKASVAIPDSISSTLTIHNYIIGKTWDRSWDGAGRSTDHFNYVYVRGMPGMPDHINFINSANEFEGIIESFNAQ